MNNYDIEQLIPQRDPIRMIDALQSVEGETAVTFLSVRPDNYFWICTERWPRRE